MGWESFIDGIEDGAGSLAKGELKDLITSSLNDGSDFVKQQAEKLKTYLEQFHSGQITKDQFQRLVTALNRLGEMELLKESVAAKASLQRLVAGISNLVLGALMKLV